MKKFLAGYPIEGTSALQLEQVDSTVRSAPIIAFPASRSAGCDTANPSARRNACDKPAARVVRRIERRALHTELVTTLRLGDATGQPFDRMRPWQAALGGCALATVAFASLLLAL